MSTNLSKRVVPIISPFSFLLQFGTDLQLYKIIEKFVLFITAKMSNLFEKLMAQSGKQSAPSTSSGRPMHDQWSGYKKIHVNGRVAAKCLNCLKVVTNTAKARLLTHR